MPVGQVDIGLYVNLKYLDLRTHFDCAPWEWHRAIHGDGHSSRLEEVQHCLSLHHHDDEEPGSSSS